MIDLINPAFRFLPKQVPPKFYKNCPFGTEEERCFDFYARIKTDRMCSLLKTTNLSRKKYFVANLKPVNFIFDLTFNVLLS